MRRRNGKDARLAQALADGLGGGRFPQWPQNPVPLASFTQADRFAPFPGSALAGASPTPRRRCNVSS
jgi:hypothetical protein